jgi:hypothetical protein
LHAQVCLSDFSSSVRACAAAQDSFGGASAVEPVRNAGDVVVPEANLAAASAEKKSIGRRLGSNQGGLGQARLLAPASDSGQCFNVSGIRDYASRARPESASR